MQQEGQTKNRMKNNITPFKNRTIDFNKPVFIYRNLMRKGVVWSVKQDGLVVGHSDKKIVLRNPEFIINASGHQRALKTGQRNVHAMVKGFIEQQNDVARYFRITYDPFKTGEFVYTRNSHPVKKNPQYAKFSSRGAFVSK